MPTDDKMKPAGASAKPDKSAGEGAPADPVRSEALLPVDRDQADDDRFAVAEEVNMDQQSDDARKVGQMPDAVPGKAKPAAPDTLAEALDNEGRPAGEGGAGARPPQPGKEEPRLMADTMPGAGPGD
ncbi:hypothetical protein [Janthinobacterium sp. CG_S6]|uniref:hypothetical protein n=1 Tax=Janthinobacterium sp. CG_S6 TaxID=3071707 RepID=UPI002DF7F0FB|nr:hypothetical protein [Janthinobacterium sp. CG_S6]